MYMHLGVDTVITGKDIIGIFDIDTCSIGKKTREYLAIAEKKGIIVNVSEDLPRAFVVCDEEVYITGISPSTLKRRSEPGGFEFGRNLKGSYIHA